MWIDDRRFADACEAAIRESRMGIGELKEKSLHRTLKHYFEPDTDLHEVAFCGSVADIKNDCGIIEIQTRSFNLLVPKLTRFLPQSDVLIVYPIIENKIICRVDPDSGESYSSRKSPRRGKIFDALSELYKISDFIPHERLSILILFLDATEIRMASGSIAVGRKRTAKIDQILTSIRKAVVLKNPSDYKILVPDCLGESFTSAEFEKASQLHKIKLHSSLMFLIKLGILEREKQGRRYVYFRKKD
jgi:hypothetical protein